MEIIDISWPITPQMTAYKDKKVVSFSYSNTFEKDNFCESTITLGSHSGTHIDAPAHFLPDGETIEKFPLGLLIGECHVLDLTQVSEYISEGDLAYYDVIKENRIILFKTSNSQTAVNQPFDSSFIYLTASAAQYLVEHSVKAVGIDYLGIERNQPNHETHKILMQNGIPIIEGLRLQHVQPGTYFLWCLPLLVEGLEAAPARAVLVKHNNK
ncbi:MAG TPA: cyclase family protein [Candidatus Babeliales bacterium]|nr:cyclase family protein [Candidatus Babeliales bacterium]